MKAITERLMVRLQIWKKINPVRRYILWYHNRVLRNIIVPYIRQEVASYGKTQDERSAKSLVHLAVKAYMKEDPEAAIIGRLNPAFVDMVVAQVKMFVFAGHENNAIVACYIYYLLSQHPSALARVRTELDSVLGEDVKHAAAVISDNPALLNQLQFTNAVIKETLRLFPPAVFIGEGQKGAFLAQPKTGKTYPTEHSVLFGCSYAMMRNSAFFPEPDRFIPERFLVHDQNDPMYVGKNFWRPFEIGPRNCIGQELAVLQMRLMLALTIREFDVMPILPTLKNPRTVEGDVCYQVGNGKDVLAHPKNGLPVTVKKRLSF
jgi:hypothetical protein